MEFVDKIKRGDGPIMELFPIQTKLLVLNLKLKILMHIKKF